MPRFADPETERTVAFLYWAHLATAACSPTLGLLGLLFARREAWFLLGTSVIALPVTLWSYALLRRGYVQVAGVVLCAVTLLLITGAGLLGATARSVVVGGYVAIVCFAGLLIGWRAALLCGILSLASVLGVYAVTLARGDPTAPGGYSGWSGVVSAIGAVASTTAMVVYLVRRLGLSAAPGLQRDSGAPSERSDDSRSNVSFARRLGLMRGAIGLSAQTASLSERDEIARRSIELVSELLVVEWAGLFLSEVSGPADGAAEADEEPHLVLAASAGRVDASIALPGERIALTSSPALALCMRHCEGRVVELGRLGLGSPAEKLTPSPDSVLLLPLCVGEDVLGVLVLRVNPSVESVTGAMDVAQVAADQIAVSLYRARVHANLRSAAAMAERAVQRHVESSWDAVTAPGSHVTGYRYTPRQIRADDSAWLPSMADAVRDGGPVVTEMDSSAVLAAPLVHSGVVIGAVGLRRPAAHPWTEEEKLLLQSVIDQVTQALENRRLFEFARDRAQRERVLRRITERVRAQADLDGALAAAAEEMRKITGATRVAIRLARPGEFDVTVRRSGRQADEGG